MPQILTATCAVTNGNATVTASAGNDWSATTVGSLFSIVGEGVLYTIGAVRGPGVTMSGRWEIDLVAPYAGTTNAAAKYSIAIDFTPFSHLSLITPGDTNTAGLFSRNMALLDTLLEAADRIKFWPLVTGFQGGTADKLDSIATAGLAVPRLWLFREGITGQLRGFFLLAGNTAETGDDLFHPVDYAAVTNEKLLVSAL